ncbi:guanine nucleotide-binding protein subunit gamma 2 [Punica granatum]|uniref:Guanine nucleotide-binding protein subunit gamma 2 n=1 Tax=Punica granatum TaxID=22663 RepID=A0A6P8CDZ9_PUNGR|nr:guanine nucleotide-binding protein subunit gamma 2 [Punica granatum]
MMEMGAAEVSEASPLARLQSMGVSDTRGKHRVQAELKRLEQEARSLEEELDQLEKMDAASVSCKEMLNNVETIPDPLLSATVGPLNPMWDRWFEGPQEAQGCSCLIM